MKVLHLNWIAGILVSIFCTAHQLLPISCKITSARHKLIVCVQLANNIDNWIFCTWCEQSVNTYSEEGSKAMDKGDVVMNTRRGLAMSTANKAELFSA